MIDSTPILLFAAGTNSGLHTCSTAPTATAAGDEGFYCIPGATDWTENCGEGVDTLALAALPKIDILSLHLYPDSWGKDAAWGTQWILRHIADGKRINRPVVLGEYGILDKATRNVVYKEWTDAVLDNGGAGVYYMDNVRAE